MAHSVIHRLRSVLAPSSLPVFTSDGLDLYFYALTAHMGEWYVKAGEQKQHWEVAAGLLYGQLKKTYRRRKIVRTEHRMRWGTICASSAAH